MARWREEQTEHGTVTSLVLRDGRTVAQVRPYAVGGYYTTVYHRHGGKQYDSPQAAKRAILRELESSLKKGKNRWANLA